VSFPAALHLIQEKLPVDSLVLPRELTVDEIKAAAAGCPPGLSLEVFIHGALCYGVSGRCYWSSFLGGKSGLRGRCVQPCRRIYNQGREGRRFFSCLDLSIDTREGADGHPADPPGRSRPQERPTTSIMWSLPTGCCGTTAATLKQRRTLCTSARAQAAQDPL
jgi:collagenase-like PrtC family protease